MLYSLKYPTKWHKQYRELCVKYLNRRTVPLNINYLTVQSLNYRWERLKSKSIKYKYINMSFIKCYTYKKHVKITKLCNFPQLDVGLALVCIWWVCFSVLPSRYIEHDNCSLYLRAGISIWILSTLDLFV